MSFDLRSPTIVKLAKYSAASLVAVPVGLSVFVVLNGPLGWGPIAANLVSVSIGAIPNYLINRRWTWHQTGKNRLWGEVVPFWVMSGLGALVSLWTVNYADNRWHNTTYNAIAQLVGFGIVWLAKFLVLDKLMWRIVPVEDPADAEIAVAD